MRDVNVVTLYKNKGDRGDCNNYRGISLLSVVGKVFAGVVLKRVQVLAEQVYPESQCGFRANRSTVDTIFSLTTTPGEMQGAKAATLHCLHIPHKGFRSGQ